MPGGDGTGPEGMGPMTGRGAGFCSGYTTPGYANTGGARYPGSGRGFRGGFGARGYKGWYYGAGFPGWNRYGMGQAARGGVEEYPFAPDMEPAQEKDLLERQADALQKQLDGIRARIDELSENQDKK
jgi:hypothetical protein